MSQIALIAGDGHLPVEIARRLTEGGSPPLVITLKSNTCQFDGIAESIVKLAYPSLTRTIKEIKKHGAKRVVMAGVVSKKLIYIPALFDYMVIKLLLKCAHDDHSLLGGVVELFEEEGIAVVPYWHILTEFVASEGMLGQRQPTERESGDVDYGVSILKVLLPCSFGQSVIIADKAVVAVEAMEGTDLAIERAGTIVKKGVLVKMMRVDQDIRYDLPTVGPKTIENMAKSGLTCMAVEAKRTIILDPEKTLSMAAKHDIAIWGLPCQSS